MLWVIVLSCLIPPSKMERILSTVSNVVNTSDHLHAQLKKRMFMSGLIFRVVVYIMTTVDGLVDVVAGGHALTGVVLWLVEPINTQDRESTKNHLQVKFAGALRIL